MDTSDLMYGSTAQAQHLAPAAALPEYRMQNQLMQLLRQYRLDVAAISFGAYALGLVATGGIRAMDLPVGLAISLISFNYIYSFNAIEDWEIDSINKPYRPIPSGRLSLTTARRYATALLILAVAYPFFVYHSLVNLGLFLLLPLLGWAYSAPPFRLKTRMVPALISIAIMYTTPIAIGLTYRPEAIGRFHAFLLVYVFVFCLSIVPLKDIEDVEGDRQHDSHNWGVSVGLPRLLLLSLAGLSASILLVWAGRMGPEAATILTALSAASAALIAGFALLQRPWERLYRSLLILIGVLGLVFFIFALLTGRSL
jgi:4-hydroxybenzoate polyprenyltransferase